MALFSYKADQDVPFLTRFYQVQLPAELEGFLLSIGIDPISAKEITKKIPLSVIDNYIEYQDAVKIFMDSLVDETHIQNTTKDIINWILKEGSLKSYPQLFPVALLDGPFDSQEHFKQIAEGETRADKFFLNPCVSAGHEVFTHGAIIHTLAIEIEKLFTGPSPFGPQGRTILPRAVLRCVECKNPYVVRNDQQEYCSFRCKNRAAARRAYARRFAEYKAVKRK